MNQNYLNKEEKKFFALQFLKTKGKCKVKHIQKRAKIEVNKKAGNIKERAGNIKEGYLEQFLSKCFNSYNIIDPYSV